MPRVFADAELLFAVPSSTRSRLGRCLTWQRTGTTDRSRPWRYLKWQAAWQYIGRLCRYTRAVRGRKVRVRGEGVRRQVRCRESTCTQALTLTNKRRCEWNFDFTTTLPSRLTSAHVHSDQPHAVKLELCLDGAPERPYGQPGQRGQCSEC